MEYFRKISKNLSIAGILFSLIVAQSCFATIYEAKRLTKAGDPEIFMLYDAHVAPFANGTSIYYHDQPDKLFKIAQERGIPVIIEARIYAGEHLEKYPEAMPGTWTDKTRQKFSAAWSKNNVNAFEDDMFYLFCKKAEKCDIKFSNVDTHRLITFREAQDETFKFTIDDFFKLIAKFQQDAAELIANNPLCKKYRDYMSEAEPLVDENLKRFDSYNFDKMLINYTNANRANIQQISEFFEASYGTTATSPALINPYYIFGNFFLELKTIDELTTLKNNNTQSAVVWLGGKHANRINKFLIGQGYTEKTSVDNTKEKAKWKDSSDLANFKGKHKSDGKSDVAFTCEFEKIFENSSKTSTSNPVLLPLKKFDVKIDEEMVDEKQLPVTGKEPKKSESKFTPYKRITDQKLIDSTKRDIIKNLILNSDNCENESALRKRLAKEKNLTVLGSVPADETQDAMTYTAQMRDNDIIFSKVKEFTKNSRRLEIKAVVTEKNDGTSILEFYSSQKDDVQMLKEDKQEYKQIVPFEKQEPEQLQQENKQAILNEDTDIATSKQKLENGSLFAKYLPIAATCAIVGGLAYYYKDTIKHLFTTVFPTWFGWC